jgi:hypothetical protein
MTAGSKAEERPLMRDPELEALQEAVRWPNPDVGTIHPASSGLSELRRRALDGLRARHQQLNPFKFIIYSEWAGADLGPAE